MNALTRKYLSIISSLLLWFPVIAFSQPSEFKGMGPEIWTGVIDNKGVTSFKGIPFAAPPVGQLRWRPPQAYSPQARSTIADKYSPICMQGPHLVNWYKDLISSIGKNPDIFDAPEGGYSEDCLYLNIWTKAMDANRPVMVWIHGGSNIGGWSYEPDYRGHNLAQKDVVVVSIAYRLGIFGNFSHPELLEGQSGKAGNYGLLDLIAALEWIQQHIHAFGGDANNVTVFGESAGAANIGYLLSSPDAKDLFHRAIHQSAGSELTRTQTLAELTDMGLSVSKITNMNSIEALKQLTTKKLLDAVSSLPSAPQFSPVAGGHSLPRSAKSVFQSNAQIDVPLMIGTNAHEWLMYIEEDGSIDGTLSSYKLSNEKEAIESALEGLNIKDKLDRISTAVEMLCPSLSIAAKMSSQQSAYAYQLTRVRQGEHWQSVGAYHGAEIPYVFNTHADWLETNSDDRALTDIMQQYWVNFAKTGNPNHKGLPQWQPFDKNNQGVLALGDQVQMVIAPDQALCDIINKTR
jgi:para-nitrobenzyl esterase